MGSTTDGFTLGAPTISPMACSGENVSTSPPLMVAVSEIRAADGPDGGGKK